MPSARLRRRDQHATYYSLQPRVEVSSFQDKPYSTTTLTVPGYSYDTVLTMQAWRCCQAQTSCFIQYCLSPHQKTKGTTTNLNGLPHDHEAQTLRNLLFEAE